MCKVILESYIWKVSAGMLLQQTFCKKIASYIFGKLNSDLLDRWTSTWTKIYWYCRYHVLTVCTNPSKETATEWTKIAVIDACLDTALPCFLVAFSKMTGLVVSYLWLCVGTQNAHLQVKPRKPLARAASVLTLSHDSWTTTNRHNSLYVLVTLNASITHLAATQYYTVRISLGADKKIFPSGKHPCWVLFLL